MRLFVAVWPDGPTRRALRGLTIETVPGIRPVRAEQWHVTLRFLGNVDPDRLPSLESALDSVCRGAAPVVAGLGPATAWIGRGGVLQVPVSGLDDLAAAVRRATGAVVPHVEGERFVGHLTLARANRRRRPEAAVRAALSGRAVTGEFPAEEVDLVVSEPSAGGHSYRTLARFPLGETRPATSGRVP